MNCCTFKAPLSQVPLCLPLAINPAHCLETGLTLVMTAPHVRPEKEYLFLKASVYACDQLNTAKSSAAKRCMTKIFYCYGFGL